MPDHEDSRHPADVTILAYLSDEKPDYVPLIASHRGLHPGYAQRRIDRLAAEGLVEAVSREVVYRITERGESVLETRRTSGETDGSFEESNDEHAMEPIREDRELAVPRGQEGVEAPQID